MTTPNSHHNIVIGNEDKLYEQIEVIKKARRYHAAALGLLPLRCDGSKQPKIAWRHLTKTQPPYSDYWFSQYDTGIGILCGQASNGLEVLDFDDMKAFEHWLCQCDNDLGFVKSLPIIRWLSHNSGMLQTSPCISRYGLPVGCTLGGLPTATT